DRAAQPPMLHNVLQAEGARGRTPTPGNPQPQDQRDDRPADDRPQHALPPGQFLQLGGEPAGSVLVGDELGVEYQGAENDHAQGDDDAHANGQPPDIEAAPFGTRNRLPRWLYQSTRHLRLSFGVRGMRVKPTGAGPTIKSGAAGLADKFFESIRVDNI